jgi:hypothetical protein
MLATSVHLRRRVADSTLVPRRSYAPKGPGAALAVGRGVTETGVASTNEDGRALTPGRVSQRFDGLVARHKIPPIRLHDLRHVMTRARGRDPGFDRRRRHQGGLRVCPRCAHVRVFRTRGTISTATNSGQTVWGVSWLRVMCS